MAAPQQPLTFTDVFDDDEEAGDIKEAPTIHHIRANSSIMQLKKILGESPCAPKIAVRELTPDCPLQSPTEVKSVSNSVLVDA